MFSWLKRFNFVSGWRKDVTLLTYLYAYAVGYSFYRNIKDSAMCLISHLVYIQLSNKSMPRVRNSEKLEIS